MKRQPVGFCTRCGKLAYNTGQINERCGAQYNSKRCSGTIRSALGEHDWSLCSFCQGEGCETCEQSGWLRARKN